MGKYKWAVTRRGENPKVIKHFNWSSHLVSFILRNPAMFHGKELDIKNNSQLVWRATWPEIKEIKAMKLKEGETRKLIFQKGRTL